MRALASLILVIATATGIARADSWPAPVARGVASPNGSYVVVRNIPASDSAVNVYVDKWQNDTVANGSYNSIYHRLLAAGFTEIDSFNRPRAFIFVYKKGNTGFVPKYVVSQSKFDRVTLSAECVTPDSLGYINSPIFGPAKSWNEVIWNGTSSDGGSATSEEADDRQDESDEEDDLRDARGAGGQTAKAEDCSEKSNDEERNGPREHFLTP